MSKTQAIVAFQIIFMMLWYMASEIRGVPVDNLKFNELWKDAQELING